MSIKMSSINPDNYKNITNKLQVGECTKVPHINCSDSNALRIENTIEGFTFYCFKCHEYLFNSNFNSPAERLKRTKIFKDQMKRVAEKDYSLPADFSQNIIPKGLAWLGKAGWTIKLIKKYNIGYSVSLHRVILPIVYNCIHKGYTARAIESWQSPKYLELCKQGSLWESKAPTTCTKIQSCVVCEDILSAGRCGEYIQAYAALGTTLDTEQLGTFMKYKTVLVWLDNDKGGETGLLHIVNRLRILSEVKIIKSEVDPKLLSNIEIKEKLCL